MDKRRMAQTRLRPAAQAPQGHSDSHEDSHEDCNEKSAPSFLDFLGIILGRMLLVSYIMMVGGTIMIVAFVAWCVCVFVCPAAAPALLWTSLAGLMSIVISYITWIVSLHLL